MAPQFPLATAEVLRNDLAVPGKLKSAYELIHKAVDVAQEALVLTERQVDNSVELHMMFRHRGID